MKVPIEEVTAKASMGPFGYTKNHAYWDVLNDSRDMVCSVFGWAGESATPEKADANAALIAHWLNNGPKLLDALRAAHKQLRQQTTFGGKYPEINGTTLVQDSHKTMAIIRPEIEAAEQVEVPE
jgi:hypothetical protein